VRAATGLLGALLAAAAVAAAAPPAPPAGGSAASAPPRAFEEVWNAQLRAEAAGDTQAAQRAMAELRRMRMERNVPSHETLGLALVQKGVERLTAGDRDGAEAAFRSAVAVAPGLPDGHFGLSRALAAKGPLGWLTGVREAIAGARAFVDTGRGAANLRDLLTVAWLLFGFALAWTASLALLLRHGGLLRHDIEEWLGPARPRSVGLGLFLLLVLLPVVAFQGWGWLPIWWMALLVGYASWPERALVALLLATTLTVGPAISALDFRLRTVHNPLYLAAHDAVEGAPDGSAISRLEQAAAADPQDKDLGYLLGAARKRAGRYEEAASLCRSLLAADPQDAFARNNLANIEFVRGAYDAALERYRAGTGSSNPGVAATSYYNLSLAHLQKFDYQAYNEARANADRLDPGLVARYDRWKYDSGDYAVVDLGLTRAQVWAKFAGAPSGVAVRNVVAGAPPLPEAGALLKSVGNRLLASLAVVPLVALLLGRWRGPRAFTVHCARCGTAFCRNCHLGAASGGLCSQCYHLFVVRDGVSGPARNRKMAEVQGAETRRQRIFRILSLLAPGAGHVYSGRTLAGSALLVAWLGVLAFLAAAAIVPFTEVSSKLVPPWWPAGPALLLGAAWLVANRLRPDFGAELPARRSGPRRSRAAQGA
jgi:tetratricopeptide (TPR) repeat protein